MDEDVRRVFSENLKRYMEAREKTQADLYKYMKVSSATASDWYNGRKLPRTDKILAIASWLGVELSDLLEDPKVPADGQSQSYYEDPKARELAEFLHSNPDYSALFDAAKSVPPEDLEFVRQMIERMGGKD